MRREMRRKGSECTRISPAGETSSSGKPMISLPSSTSRRARAPPDREEQRPRQVHGAAACGGSRLFRTFYRRARASVVMAFRSSASNKRTAPGAASPSPDCTPKRSSSRRQQQSAPPVVVVDDSHKSEAVEECIRFMNSSSRKYR